MIDWGDRKPGEQRNVDVNQRAKCNYCSAKCKVISKDSVETNERSTFSWFGMMPKRPSPKRKWIVGNGGNNGPVKEEKSTSNVADHFGPPKAN